MIDKFDEADIITRIHFLAEFKIGDKKICDA
jgi:hypothetical protein